MPDLTYRQISKGNHYEMDFQGSDGLLYKVVMLSRVAGFRVDFAAHGWEFRGRECNELVSMFANYEKRNMGPTYMELWVKDPSKPTLKVVA